MNRTCRTIGTRASQLFFAVLAMVFTVSCANQPNITGKAGSHWVMLGSRAIEFIGSEGNDAISVSDKEGYSQLRFKIDSRGTTLREITVTYFDGTQQDIKDINAVMAPGQFSKTIVLPGESKRIMRVGYTYGGGTGGGGKGMMRLYAYKVVKL